MEYFINLPDYFKNFIYYKDSIDTLIENKIEHTWVRFPIKEFVNNQGLDWFKDRNLKLLDFCNLFNAHEFTNTYSNIHVDTMGDHLNEFAVNYILFGNGEMQWTKVDGSLTIRKINSSYFYGYENIREVEILDKWSGSVGLVKINIPHRIVTTNLRRICLSLRFRKTCSFEDFKKLL